MLSFTAHAQTPGVAAESLYGSTLITSSLVLC
jgi:hypothetical protein